LQWSLLLLLLVLARLQPLVLARRLLLGFINLCVLCLCGGSFGVGCSCTVAGLAVVGVDGVDVAGVGVVGVSVAGVGAAGVGVVGLSVVGVGVVGVGVAAAVSVREVCIVESTATTKSSTCTALVGAVC